MPRCGDQRTGRGAATLIASLQGSCRRRPARESRLSIALPPDDIGGIDQLESFLNDVRIILGLPTVATSTASTAPKEDYDSDFDELLLNLKGAQDFLQSLVNDLKRSMVSTQDQLSRLQTPPGEASPTP